MNRDSRTIVSVSIIIIAIIIGNLKSIDYSFIEPRYSKYIKEFISEMEYHGINIPEQSRWTARTEPSLFTTTTIGIARGMYDDRQVNVWFTPMLRYQKEDYIRFVVWHELAHDIFNLKHGSTLLMKNSSSGNDDELFPIAKELFIKHIKLKQKL